MAATYSSFMTTRFYSPVFNTALFDGPLRIYFSQSYESVALKIYHLLQSQYADTWAHLKNQNSYSKRHLFLMIYPEDRDLQMVFEDKSKSFHAQEWEEGLSIGCVQARNDQELQSQLDFIIETVKKWTLENKVHEISRGIQA